MHPLSLLFIIPTYNYNEIGKLELDEGIEGRRRLQENIKNHHFLL